MATKPKKKISSISVGRARKGANEGSAKAAEISDAFALRSRIRGASMEGVSPTPQYGTNKKKPSAMGKAADAAYAKYKPLAKKGK